MMTKNELLKRTGWDWMRFDRRPLSEALGDEIPERRWQAEFAEVRKQGYASWQEWLASTASAKKNRN